MIFLEVKNDNYQATVSMCPSVQDEQIEKNRQNIILLLDMHRDQRAKQTDGQFSMRKHTETPSSTDATCPTLSNFVIVFRTFIQNHLSLGWFRFVFTPSN